MNDKKYLTILLTISLLLIWAAGYSVISSLSLQDLPAITSDLEQVKGQLTLTDGRVYDVEVMVPEYWAGKYGVRAEGNVIFFDYNASTRNLLFSISAFTEAQWQEVMQEPGHGMEIQSVDGVTFVYNIALDNPYLGAQAEEFQKMAGEVKSVTDTLAVSPANIISDIETARVALEAFFDQLSEGKYAEAAELYGGSYEELMDLNPDIDPTDHAALLERACTINGFQCLKITDIVQQNQDLQDTFTFTVEFEKQDGALFELSPCCGEDQIATPPQSHFDFTVNRVPQANNAYLVQGLPVYVP